MKKLNIIILLAILATGAAFAQDSEYAITLTADTSTVIMPPRDNKETNLTGLWATNSVVANGEIYRIPSTHRDYMVLVGGTTSATNIPSAVGGQVEANGTATVIHCNYIAPRTVGYSTQEADAKVWYHTGYVASTNGGEYAYLEGQQCRKDYNGAISVISDSDVKLNILDK